MRVEAKGWATAAIAILAAAAVGGGLALSGGPMKGRMERHDMDREQDLRRLSAQVRCLADEASGVLPEKVVTTGSCPDEVRLEDPFTGEPYRYEVIDARSYRLCAGFELPFDSRRRIWGDFERDSQAGCLVWHLPPERTLPEPAPPEPTPPAPPPLAD